MKIFAQLTDKARINPLELIPTIPVKIRPRNIQTLWLRLSLDKGAPNYKIIDCKCVSMPNRYANYADFRCVATAGQHTHEVTLRFYAQECKWYLTVNNSSPLAAE